MRIVLLRLVWLQVDLSQLQVNTLRRYKRHFKLQVRPGLNKAQLVEVSGACVRISYIGAGGGGGTKSRTVFCEGLGKCSGSTCCKRRIHKRDSNPAPLSFRDSALPIRLPPITHIHGSLLLRT